MKIKDYISKLNYQLSIVEVRKRIARDLLDDSLVEGRLLPLSAEQVKAVERVWGSRKQMFDWRWFELYNWRHEGIGEDIWRFIPVDYWLAYIDPLFAQPVGGFVFDDKNMYDLYLPDVRQPKTVVRFIDGQFQDAEYHIIDKNRAVELCKSAGRVVAKPAVATCGGVGIAFWDVENDSPEGLLQMFSDGRCYVVQEVVRQHRVMASLNESSCNTIRMLSILCEGTVEVIPSSYTRFGGKGSVIDNVSMGGFSAGVDPNGRVYATARNHYEAEIETPGGGTPLVIPNYHKCQQIARDAAPRLAHVSKLIAWDFAIGEDAEPVLIEVNFERTSIQSFQSLIGPVFGDYVAYFLRNAPDFVGSKNRLSRGLMKMLAKM